MQEKVKINKKWFVQTCQYTGVANEAMNITIANEPFHTYNKSATDSLACPKIRKGSMIDSIIMDRVKNIVANVSVELYVAKWVCKKTDVRYLGP